jgi:hypothetical protein
MFLKKVFGFRAARAGFRRSGGKDEDTDYKGDN